MTYPVMLGAIVLTSANNAIRVKEGATTATTTIAAGTYYLRGDGAAGDFFPAFVTALQAATASVNTYTAVPSRSIAPGTAHTLVTITRASGADNFQILWADALTTFDETLLGFTANTADNASDKVSTQACGAAWVSNDGMGELEPYSERVASVSRSASGRVSGVSRSARMQSWRTRMLFVDERRLFVEQALAGAQDTLEGFMEDFGAGAAMEFHDADVSSGTTLAALSSSTLVDVMHFSEDALTRFEPQRVGPGVPLYHLPMTFHAQVAT